MSRLGNTHRVVTALALAGLALTVLAPGAHAAQLSGSFKASAGSADCTTSVSCATFKLNCAAPTANDVDGSVRTLPAGVAGKTWRVSGSGTSHLMVMTFGANCGVLQTTTLAASGAQFAVSGSARWIAVMSRFACGPVDWTIG